MKKWDWKDIANRTIKTFVQVFLSTATVAMVMSFDDEALFVAASSAGAAAISVVWNAALEWSRAT